MDLIKILFGSGKEKQEAPEPQKQKTLEELEQVFFYEPFSRIECKSAKVVLIKGEDRLYLRGSFSGLNHYKIVQLFQSESGALEVTEKTGRGVPKSFKSDLHCFEVQGGCKIGRRTEINSPIENTLFIFGKSIDYGSLPKPEVERLLQEYLLQNNLFYKTIIVSFYADPAE